MHRRAWLLIGVLAALWGASYMFIKVGLDDDLHPATIVFLRTALGALVLVPIALSRRAFAAVRPHLGWVLVLAVAQVAVPFLLITVGEEHISSSLAGILVSAAPIFTALLALMFDAEERSTGLRLVGIVIGIAGVALLFGVDLTGGTEELLGGLAVLLAALGYAVGAMLIKHRLPGVPPVGIAGTTMAFAALVMVPLAALHVPSHGVELETVGAMIGLGAGGTGLAFLIFYTLIADVGPARASIVAYIAPGFAVIYGATLLDEAIGVATVIGLVLILAGSYLGAEGKLPGRGAKVAEPEPTGVDA
ncbi:MAG TPA: DMT family transporter [Capillimicrobium sp.]